MLESYRMPFTWYRDSSKPYSALVELAKHTIISRFLSSFSEELLPQLDDPLPIAFSLNTCNDRISFLFSRSSILLVYRWTRHLASKFTSTEPFDASTPRPWLRTHCSPLLSSHSFEFYTSTTTSLQFPDSHRLREFLIDTPYAPAWFVQCRFLNLIAWFRQSRISNNEGCNSCCKG